MRNKQGYLILLVALLVLRLSLAWIIAQDESLAVQPDSFGYISLADNLLYHGKYYIDDGSALDLFRTPGYPAFLSLIFWLCGRRLWVVALIQLALSGACAWGVFAIGRRWLNPIVGLLAGLSLALLPNFAVWSLTALSETLFTFLMVLGLYELFEFIAHPGWIKAMLVGALTGAAILVRPIGLVLALIWGAVLLWYSPGGKAIQQKAKYTLAFLGVLAAFLLPWMVRNAIVWDSFSVSNVSRWNLINYIAPAVLAEEQGSTVDEARERIPLPSTETAEYIDILVHNPVSTAKVWVRSLSHTLLGYGRTTLSEFWGEPYDVKGAFELLRQGKLGEWFQSLATPGQFKAFLIMAVLVGIPIIVLCLVLVGTLEGWRSGGQNRMVTGILFITLLALLLPVVGVGNARFRVPIEPILALLAATGIVRLARSKIRSDK